LIRYHLGMSYAAVGQADKASAQFKKALELTADDTLVNEIGNALEKVQ